MGKRLEGLRSLRSKGAILPAIIGGGALAFFIVAALVRWHAPAQPATSARRLSTKTKERLEAKARNLAPAASFYFSYASLEAEALAKLDAKDLDEGVILEFCQRIVDGSDAFVREFSGEIREAAAIEGAPPADVQRYLSEKLRELDRDSGQIFRTLPGISPFRLSILAAPRRMPQSGNGLGPEAAKVQAIQHLLEVLVKLPPNSNGAQGVKNAIGAMRRAIIPFDTTPIVVTFTSPSPNAILNSIPAVAFSMTDTGSGPDPNSRQLLAINNGPVTTGTTDLTSFSTVTLNNQLNGIVQVAATNIPAATIQDGFITLQASGTDFANNPRTAARVAFILDRVPPNIEVTTPAQGATLDATIVPLIATITDAVSGVTLSSIKVTLNGTDVTASITQTPGPVNELGAPSSVDITGALSSVLGNNQLTISSSDLAGNAAIQSVLFTVSITAVGSFTIDRLPLALEIVGAPPTKGLSGRCPKETLVVRVKNAETGQPVEGVPVEFEVTEGNGVLSYDENLGTTSDSSGQVSARILLDSAPGQNIVRASVSFDPNVAPVEFVMTGQLPRLDGLQPGAQLREFAGSALDGIIRLQAVDPDGNPLKGEAVIPFSPTIAGSQEPIATFLPTRAITDEGGNVSFAVVLNPSAPPNTSATLEFRLAGFRDGGGNSVHADLGVTVLDDNTIDPSTGKQRVVRPVAGQSQISAPLHTLSQPLVVELVNPNINPALFFEVIEGDGEIQFESGSLLGPPVKDAGGRTIGLFIGAVNGRAGVTYTSGSQLALGLVCILSTDCFAIGIPEATVVRQRFQRDADGNIVLDSQGKPIPVLDPSGQLSFEELIGPEAAINPADVFDTKNTETSVSQDLEIYVEAKLPKAYAGTACARVSSLSFCRAPLSFQGGFGDVKNDVQFKTSEDKGTFVLRRTKPIVVSKETPIDATVTQPVVDLQQGDAFLQGVSMGYVKPEVVLRPGTSNENAVAGISEILLENFIVLLIDVDGVGRKVLEEELAAGNLPKLKDLLGAQAAGGGVTYEKAVSKESVADFPALTLNSHASLFTGEKPNKHLFAGNSWFDRVDFRYYQYGPGAVPFQGERDAVSTYVTTGTECIAFLGPLLAGEHRVTGETGGPSRFLSPDVKVIHEHARKANLVTAATLTYFDRGAFAKPHASLSELENTFRSYQQVLRTPAADRTAPAISAAGAVDDVIIQKFSKTIKVKPHHTERTVIRFIPRLQVIYQEGPDDVAHFAGEAAGRAYLKAKFDDNADRIYKMVVEQTKRRVILALVSDHGHLDVPPDREDNKIQLYNTFSTLQREIPSLATKRELEEPLQSVGYHDPLDRIVEALAASTRDTVPGPFLVEEPFPDRPATPAFDHVIAFDGGAAFMYLVDRTGDPLASIERNIAAWRSPPRFEEDVLPVAQAFELANVTNGHPLFRKIDKILVRNSERDGFGAQYLVYVSRTVLVPLAEGLPESDLYFKRDFRMKGFPSRRTGDIVLLARMNPNDINQRFYFANSPLSSEHGWMSRTTAENVFIVASPQQAELKARIEEAMQKAIRDPSNVHISDMNLVIRHLLGF